MRLALVGAFPFPLPQGSQVFVAQQARALRDAGAHCSLQSYASIPAVLAPRSGRSGPSLAKPVADAALLAAYVRAQRRERCDALLAHNAEAAVIGILARPLTRVPVVYVAHTLLRYELSAYGPAGARRALDRVGQAVDAWIARRAQGIIALSQDARERLAPSARCPLAVIPPGLDPATPPSRSRQEQACRAAGVVPGRFVLYAGNLDAYQDLDLLDTAAARLAADPLPVLVATHDARDGARRYRHLRIFQTDDFASVRALHFAAQSLVLTRRRPGGFPIKLLNYLEAARPIVAFGRIAPGLVDGVQARLLERDAGPERLARLLRELRDDPARADSLGRAGHAHLVAVHAWPRLARDTLAFIERALLARP